MMTVVPKIQANRTAMTTPLTAAPYTKSSQAEWPLSPSRICGSWRPMSTNSVALSRNWVIVQNEKPCRRDSDEAIWGARQPR